MVAVAIAALSGCDSDSPTDPDAPFTPNYLGVETLLMDTDLVNIRVAMTGARDNEDVATYARCAAAQYALIRGYYFARHVRTSVAQARNGVWTGDAVYVISPALPDGLNTLDAEVTVQDCAENGIPTV